jgi:hypothetical protein
MDNKVIKPKIIIKYPSIIELLPHNLNPVQIKPTEIKPTEIKPTTKKKLIPLKICNGQCDKCIDSNLCI